MSKQTCKPFNNPCNSQSLKEEISNAISHGIGAVLFIAATVLMIVFAAKGQKGATAIVSVSVFGGSLILLYLTSCLYHSLTGKGKRVFKILDHNMIYVLILGTYTPICLTLIKEPLGIVILCIDAACSIVGIVLNSIDLKRFDKVSQILYIILGYSIVLGAFSVVKNIPKNGIFLILLGGLFYTAGTYFYRKKDTGFSHFIWHLFVLMGSIPHLIMVFLYVCI